jgi:AcrR family transcriptional regulator
VNLFTETLRRIAEKVEYSPTAIYFHFKDKDALIRELCDCDFLTLAEQFTGAAQIANPIERLKATGRAYAAFGLEHGATVRDASDLGAAVRDWAPAGFDVVLDLVGGAYTPASIDVLAMRGRLMLVGLVAGATASVDLRRILSRRIAVIGTMLRGRSVDEKAAATRAISPVPDRPARRGRLPPTTAGQAKAPWPIAPSSQPWTDTSSTSSTSARRGTALASIRKGVIR